MTLTILAKVRAAPGTQDTICTELRKLVAPTRAEEGCELYDFYADAKDPQLFIFFEIWQSRAHWQAHMTTPHMQACLKSVDGLGPEWTVHELNQLEA